jgi:thiol-disulfide isomerase/thioredoxin
MFRKYSFVFAGALLINACALAQQDSEQKRQEEVKPLTIGDPARSIEIQEWIKGTPVTKFEDGKVYVIEFWATWCGPCLASMPHISELQEKYRDYGVTFIGVSDEPLETVTKFLDKKDKQGKIWDEKIKYTLTTDPDESVHRDYMEAAAQQGIPTAFIIGKDQHVEWIGHPMSIDKPLEEVVKDSWNRNEFKVKFEKEQAAEREAMKQQNELRTAMREKDWDKVMSLLDAQIALDDQNFFPKFQKFNIMLVQMEQPKQAYAYAEEITKQHWDEAMALNHIAWFIVDSPQVKERNLDLALKMANRGVELEQNNAAILDTLARVHYEKGDLKKAVEIQRKAVQHAEEGMAEQLKTALEKYESEAAKKKGS